MRRQSSPFIELSWLKVVFLLFILAILIIIGFSVYLYQSVNTEKTKGFSDTRERVEQQLEIASIDDISRYHGSKYFHVVEAKSTSDEHLVIFVDQTDQDAELVTYYKEDWIEIDHVLDEWRNQTVYQEIYHTQIGLRHQTPLLEIVYLDESGRLSYDYYRLDNGEYDSGISFANH
ncbi:hypothetical protein [Amphibacillus cookii]|uniref:hypothetical protein n=1 Tax=Amphibacillus cookii TaxID=767787 RepID=UPI00195B67CE|nr:hypothetical protein [Amphibacillus cookii]MBM7542538.1 uncharacterized protein YpmB [Amphibacillus cookii]